jgi:hypothetical protein
MFYDYPQSHQLNYFKRGLILGPSPKEKEAITKKMLFTPSHPSLLEKGWG